MEDRAEAEAYAAADFGPVNAAFVERMAELVERLNPPLADTSAVVDLGTGPGDIPVRTAQQFPGWHVTAVDASAAMLEIARATVSGCPDVETPSLCSVAGRIELVLADAKQTGLPAHAYDVVFSNSILHHVNDTARLWAEVKRLGKPGALVFFRDLARPESREAAARIIETYAGDESRVLREEYHRSLLSSYTPDEVRAQLATAGLRSLCVEMATDRHWDAWGRLPDGA
jgi:ubiquinone/menaquinone biosynthesis C-methylase UbiE